jgi:transposase
MITLKAILIHAPEQLRHDMAKKTQIMLARHLAALRPTRLETPDDSIRHTLKSLARRWQRLNAEATELEAMIKDLVTRTAPQLIEPFGIGIDTAAEILIVVGDNPERIQSEAALAKLAGISPIPASSGMTSGRQRINHGGHRQLNAAIYRTVIVRMRFHQPTIDYVARRPSHGRRTQQTRHHPLPQTLRHPRGLPPHRPSEKRGPNHQLTTIEASTQWPNRSSRR